MRADSGSVVTLLKTAKGQIDGVIKMIDDDRYCIDISHQLLSANAILRKANKEIIKGHLEGCLKEAFESGDETEKQEKIEEIYSLLDDIMNK